MDGTQSRRLWGRGKGGRWGVAPGGGGKPKFPTPPPRRMPGAPAVRARSEPRGTPASAGDTERGKFVIPESAQRLSGTHPAEKHPCCWVPDICCRKFRDDKMGLGREQEVGIGSASTHPTFGACGRRGRDSIPTKSTSPADAGVSRGEGAEPAAGDSGIRRRCGEREVCHPG
jgi:hypothetical protein